MKVKEMFFLDKHSIQFTNTKKYMGKNETIFLLKQNTGTDKHS